MGTNLVYSFLKGALIHHQNGVCEIFKKDFAKSFFKAGTFRKSIMFFAQYASLKICKVDNYLVPGIRMGYIYTKYIYA